MIVMVLWECYVNNLDELWIKISYGLFGFF